MLPHCKYATRRCNLIQSVIGHRFFLNCFHFQIIRYDFHQAPFYSHIRCTIKMHLSLHVSVCVLPFPAISAQTTVLSIESPALQPPSHRIHKLHRREFHSRKRFSSCCVKFSLSHLRCSVSLTVSGFYNEMKSLIKESHVIFPSTWLSIVSLSMRLS